MIELERTHWREVLARFEPVRPGPQVADHVALTGRDEFRVDRWPAPRVVLARVDGNLALRGEPSALEAGDLAGLSGLLEAPDGFEGALRLEDPALARWPRVIFALDGAPDFAIPAGVDVRRLEPGDRAALAALPEQIAWIHDTLGGAAGLAASGLGWGAFESGRLLAVAASFFVGRRYEDIGVVTEAEARGRGLVPACAGRLCEDIRARGRIPSWSTSPDNLPSLRVAEKLGFAKHRDDALYVLRMPVPGVAAKPSA